MYYVYTLFLVLLHFGPQKNSFRDLHSDYCQAVLYSVRNHDLQQELQLFIIFPLRSFDFNDMRIDEALRLYLETFRLPGESPLISLLMEHFAEHWHVSLQLILRYAEPSLDHANISCTNKVILRYLYL